MIDSIDRDRHRSILGNLDQALSFEIPKMKFKVIVGAI